jgi:cation:H+ antiporter
MIGLNLLLLAGGMVLLVFGADFLVRGVSVLARTAGVPPLIIGLTLVAFGTSLPEVVINTVSAWHGETNLAFGNLVGACSLNVGVVLAVAAMIAPLRIEASILLREMPMMLLAVAAIVVLSGDSWLSGAPARQLVRGDGIMLLLLFCVFLYYVIRGAMNEEGKVEIAGDPMAVEVSENIDRGKGPGSDAAVKESIPRALLETIGGLVGVAAGGRVAVMGAIRIAEAMNVPQEIIGFTLVSFGTTLPELATSITAARRGQSDIAVGNVIGSNIFNLLFIGGIVSTITPVDVPKGGTLDLLFMAGLCAVLLPMAMFGKRKITRAQGAMLFASYLVYATWRTFFS